MQLNNDNAKIKKFREHHKTLYKADLVYDIKWDFSGKEEDKALGFLNIKDKEDREGSDEKESKEKGSLYTDQRDNTFSESKVFTKYKNLIHGDNMCNVTSLTMQLKKLYPNEEKLKADAIQILKDKGYSGSKKSLENDQIEDVILKIFKQLGDKYFEKNAGIEPNSKYGPHQYANGLNHVGKMFLNYVGGSIHKSGIETKDSYDKIVAPHLAKGGAVLLSTKLTGGHIVYLESIEDDGILIHDPYGMRLPKGYVKNNDIVSARKNRITGDLETFNRRTKKNTALRDSLNKLIEGGTNKNFTNNLGELNFFSWDEVKTYKIGKWVNILTKK